MPMVVGGDTGLEGVRTAGGGEREGREGADARVRVRRMKKRGRREEEEGEEDGPPWRRG